VFLSPKYGPRVRLGTILTDAELEPDPLYNGPPLCNKCMKCVKLCPGGAIPLHKEKPPIRIQIDDKAIEWGDTHMGRCTLTHHGFNWESSPFLKKDLPGFKLDVRNSNMSEEAAYKITYPVGKAGWQGSLEFPENGVVNYYKQILEHVGYFAICGARGCIRGCMESLEKRKAIKQSKFPTPVFPDKPWELQDPEKDKTGGVAEGKFPDLFTVPDKTAGNWK